MGGQYRTVVCECGAEFEKNVWNRKYCDACRAEKYGIGRCSRCKANVETRRRDYFPIYKTFPPYKSGEDLYCEECYYSYDPDRLVESAINELNLCVNCKRAILAVYGELRQGGGLGLRLSQLKPTLVLVPAACAVDRVFEVRITRSRHGKDNILLPVGVLKENWLDLIGEQHADTHPKLVRARRRILRNRRKKTCGQCGDLFEMLSTFHGTSVKASSFVRNKGGNADRVVELGGRLCLRCLANKITPCIDFDLFLWRRDNPDISLDTIIVGSGYYTSASPQICSGDELRLVRGPNNPHDSNAIAVCDLRGAMLGHLPRTVAARLYIELDHEIEWSCRIFRTEGDEDELSKYERVLVIAGFLPPHYFQKKMLTSSSWLDAETRWYIFQRDNFTCVYCGRCALKTKIRLVPDHLIPRSYGGAHSVNNLVTSCNECNAGKKGTLLPDRLLQEVREKIIKVNEARYLEEMGKQKPEEGEYEATDYEIMTKVPLKST